jgi:hypothetical protein
MAAHMRKAPDRIVRAPGALRVMAVRFDALHGVTFRQLIMFTS